MISMLRFAQTQIQADITSTQTWGQFHFLSIPHQIYQFEIEQFHIL